MLVSVKDVKGYMIHSLDQEEFGRAKQFFFDDEKWTVRYFVLDTSKWLPGKNVLISPLSIKEYDHDKKLVYVDLTKDRIENSPDIDTEQPISRQHEMEYNRYYGFPFYWGGSGVWGNGMYPVGMVNTPVITEVETANEETEEELEKQHERNSHLRSTNEVIGYHIHARDGEIGHVDDFIIDDESWNIRYLVVDTSNWWFGKKILLSPDWIEKVSWKEKSVHVDLDKTTIKDGPEYDPNEKITDEYESVLHEMYRKDVR